MKTSQASEACQVSMCDSRRRCMNTRRCISDHCICVPLIVKYISRSWVKGRFHHNQTSMLCKCLYIELPDSSLRAGMCRTPTKYLFLSAPGQITLPNGLLRDLIVHLFLAFAFHWILYHNITSVNQHRLPLFCAFLFHFARQPEFKWTVQVPTFQCCHSSPCSGLIQARPGSFP